MIIDHAATPNPLAAKLSGTTVDELRVQLRRMTARELRNAAGVFRDAVRQWEQAMYVNGEVFGAPALSREVAEAGLALTQELLPDAVRREQAEHNHIQAEQERERRRQEAEQLEACRASARAVADALAHRDRMRAELAESVAASPVGRFLSAQADAAAAGEAFRRTLAATGGMAAQLAALEALGDAATPARTVLDRHPGGLPAPAPAAVLFAELVDSLAALPMLLEGLRALHGQVARLEAR